MNLHIRPAKEEDFDFTFEAKRDAMGPHISIRWGWDQDFQVALHRQRWQEKPWSVIMLDRECIGTVSLLDEPDAVRFGEFYILSEHRGKGFGTAILRQVLDRCDEHHQRTRLEYLKWNPVGTLYKRHGFEVVSENEIHFFMLREPSVANKAKHGDR